MADPADIPEIELPPIHEVIDDVSEDGPTDEQDRAYNRAMTEKILRSLRARKAAGSRPIVRTQYPTDRPRQGDLVGLTDDGEIRLVLDPRAEGLA